MPWETGYGNAQTLLVGFGLNEAAFAARQQLGREAYPNPVQVPSTMIGVARFNLPALLVEIRVVAKQAARYYFLQQLPL